MKIIYGLIFLVAIGVILIIGYRFFNKDTIYIAVAGPLTGDNAFYGKTMLQGVDLYLEKINQAGGIYGKQVKRLQFDDGGRRCDRVPPNDPAPRKCAKEVANQISISPALAVIGHYSSEPSLEAAEVYKSKGIPVITSTATADDITKDNPWYFRVTFKDSDQAAVIANYAHKILGYKASYIFYDNDSYGRGLKKSFSNTASKIGLKIQNEHKWGFDQEQDNSFKNNLNQMIETLKTFDEKEGILFLATHPTEAIKVIRELRRLPYKLPIISTDALSSSGFRKILNRYPQEKAFPGYYTDGIYVASPFLLDIAGRQAQYFYQQYKKKYQMEKDRETDIGISVVTPALYYDATMVAVEAIKQMLAPQEGTEVATHLEDQRKQVRNHLRQLSRLENAVEGVTGSLYFDSNGDAIKSIPIGIYNKGKPVTAWYQYQPLTAMPEANNLLRNILNNNIIQVNDKFMQKAQVVYTGIDFNDISELDLNQSTYKADFYVWFRFLQPNKTQQHFDYIDFINIFDPKDNDIKKAVL
ncbi:MAG: ABC transporter substrate-binding protein [Thioploca sp.]|nr:ABC transporter substrate-binding protein [Thioploca sp.]